MDGIVGVLQFAIDGLGAQQNATANNLANANTPGFTATDVSFEDSLATALHDAPGSGVASITSAASATPANSDGNNVNTGNELLNAQSEGLQYQAISEMLTSQFSLEQTAAGAGA